MQPKIAILTDSCSDIPSDMADSLGITIIPQVVVWNGVSYRDRIDMQAIEFYSRLKTDPVHPTTSQASVQTFADYFEQARQNGAEEIICYSVSGALSGTIQSATNAAEMSQIPVHLVDTKDATMGQGWQVIAAARKRTQGANVDEILAAGEYVRQHVVMYIYLDTLEYLHRGGRIGNATKFIGMMLNIRPVITVNAQSGLVDPVGIARTRKKGIEQMIDRFFGDLPAGRPLHVCVLDGLARPDAEQIGADIEAKHHPAELIYNTTGPVLGIHTGPGALALAGYAEEAAA